MIEVRGLVWLGTRTERFAQTAVSLADVVGLAVEHQTAHQAVLALPDGATVEVFAAGEAEHEHFTTGPVGGFLVDDVEAARVELEAAGVELLGPVGRGGPGEAWQDFRAPTTTSTS